MRALSSVATCILLAVLLALASTGTAATSSTVITMTVPSATSLIANACAPGVAGRTDFGTVLPGSSVTTTSDCAVAFGSSNDSSQLRMFQADRLGVGMYSPSRGALDTSFDGDGRVTTSVGPAAVNDHAFGVAVQPDGLMVVVGDCAMGGTTGVDACVARYTAAGALDTTFDGDGRVTTATAPGTATDAAFAVVVQPDGKVVTAGRCDMGGATGADFCLARYTTGGALDTTFDGDGRVTTAAPGGGAGADTANAIALQPDGRILVAGECTVPATGTDGCVARYLTTGALDISFGGNGVATTAFGAGTSTDIFRSIAVQPDGRIVVAGICAMGATGDDSCLARYNADGSLDVSFDTDGRVTTATGAAGAADHAYAVVVRSDGTIVSAGDCYMGAVTGTDFCLARYQPNGALDSTFDADGRVTTAIGAGALTDVARGMVDGMNGQVAVAGYCSPGGATGTDMCMARYNADGSLDLAFDGDGRLATDFGPWDQANAVTLLPDGRYAAAGECDMGATGYDLCLASYDEQGLISQYADDGVSDWDTTGTAPRLFGACLRAVSGGATAQWATSATCPASDGTYWNAVPTSPTKVAYNTALEPDPADATASFRFGMRTSGNQPPGSYIAPITFEVLAPNA